MFGSTESAILGGAAAFSLLLAAISLIKWRYSAKSLKVEARRLAEFEERYRPITDIEKVTAELEVKLSAARHALQNEQAAIDARVRELQADYSSKRATYDRLSREIASVEERLDFAELGIYQPAYNFESSAQYMAALEANITLQKQMISAGDAIVSEAKWSVDGSEAKGRTMTNRAIRMTLRAFNNECEVIIGKATWKNFSQMVERIRKSQATLDKLNESNRVSISSGFVDLKLKELRLTYEERLKRREEQEKLREEREQEREEAKAQRELEIEVRRATKKEDERREALMEARAELRAAGEAEAAALQAKISELEERLSAAHSATERAMSMAQQTRAGYVYVISNIGAFGEEVFKIGMTRRLEPLDRVRELGDASVPFPFDVHALIFTEDAPALERALQTEFDQYRINRVNSRKEFFKLPSTELKTKILARFADTVYRDRPDAEEYMQSLPKPAIEAIIASKPQAAFPSAL